MRRWEDGGMMSDVGKKFPRPLGRYTLEARIAFGGMAEVFIASTSADGFKKQLCIKQILQPFAETKEFMAMFSDEAALVANLNHANVVQVFDHGTENGAPYLVMEYVDGADLHHILRGLSAPGDGSAQGGGLSIEEVLTIGRAICAGLHYVHQAKDVGGAPLGLVHRDLSPHNILVSVNGEVKITDFGIALGTGRETKTQTGVAKGKTPYMSPEQAEGANDLDPRSDQFSVGAVLWEMLTGRRLFGFEKPDHVALLELLDGEIALPSAHRAGIPPGIEKAVMRALSRERADRFADMRALQHVLTKALFASTDSDAAAGVDLGRLAERFGRRAAKMPTFEATKVTDGTAASAGTAALTKVEPTSAATTPNDQAPLDQAVLDQASFDQASFDQAPLEPEFYSAEASGEEVLAEASAYGTASAIYRTAQTEKYGDLIARLERGFPFRTFSDLVERFVCLRTLPGARPFDPFLLLASVTDLPAETFAEDRWQATETQLKDPRFVAALFMVRVFLAGKPVLVGEKAKSLWNVATKAAYLSVFRHYENKALPRGDAPFGIKELQAEIAELSELRQTRVRNKRK